MVGGSLPPRGEHYEGESQSKGIYLGEGRRGHWRVQSQSSRGISNGAVGGQNILSAERPPDIRKGREEKKKKKNRNYGKWKEPEEKTWVQATPDRLVILTAERAGAWTEAVLGAGLWSAKKYQLQSVLRVKSTKKKEGAQTHEGRYADEWKAWPVSSIQKTQNTTLHGKNENLMVKFDRKD